MSEVQVTVSGFTGAGKSAIYGEIVLALEAIGVKVQHAHPEAWAAECSMTHADWQESIDLYRPVVTMVEANIPRKPKAAPKRRWWQIGARP